MYKRKNKKLFSCLIVLAMILSLICGYCEYHVIDAQAMTKSISALFIKQNSSKDEDKQYKRIIVSLDSKSLADTNKINKYNSSLKKKEDKLINKQNTLVKKVERITGKKVKIQCSYLVNAFSIDATTSQMAKISKLDGVNKVFEAPIFKAQMSNAVKTGNALKQYNTKKYGYTGAGTIIAIIDTGVNYQHQDMVLDSNVKNKYTKSEWAKKIKLLGYGKYFTDKVPFGYDYTTGKNDCLSKEDFHGYHVAGTAAANGDIQGIAKNAQLLGLRVLNDNGYGTFDDILCAIEDAVKLGADVINMSLGQQGGNVSSDDFLQKAIDNATKNGVVVSVAMGNFGTSTGANDSTNLLGLTDTSNNSMPAIAKNAIAVGATTNPTYKTSGTMKAALGSEEVSFSYVDLMGYGFNMENVELVDTGLGVNEDNHLSVPASSIKDKIAVVKRGTYTFNSKLYNLSLAEPKGIILIDTESTITNNVRPYDWCGVPVIFINSVDGETILNAAKNNQTFTVLDNSIGKENVYSVEMASFSQWGPGNNLSIKPEIVAPGDEIKSTLEGKDNYGLMSGTSMATPYISGAETVMLNAVKARKLNISKANLSKFLKNSLMNTADPFIDSYIEQPYSVRYQGAGMVDVYGAVNNYVLATCKGEAKVELGSIKSGKTFDITLKNYGSKKAVYSLKSAQIYADFTENSPYGEYQSLYGIEAISNAKITFSASKITVPANKSVTIKAKVNLPKNYPSNSYVEAFIKFVGNNVENIGLPVLGFNGNWGSETIIDSSIYDNKKATLDNDNNYTGVTSHTGLINPNQSEYDELLGTYWVKSTNFNEFSDKNNDTEDNDNKDSDVPDIDITTLKDLKDMTNAININVGDTIQVPFINQGDEYLYKLSSSKDIQYSVTSNDLKYCLYKIYDSNGHFITSNQYIIESLPYLNLKFSMKAHSSYYISFSSYLGDIGIYNLNFSESEYDEDYDLKNVSLVNNFEPLSLNKTTTLKNDNNYVHEVMFKPEQTGFYSFNIKAKSVVKLSIYDYLDNMDRIMTEYMDVYSGYKTVNRTYKLQAGKTYILCLSSDIGLTDGGIFATITVNKSNGDKAYVLKGRYNGSYNAFSPNGDDINDEAIPGITLIRTAKKLNVNILNNKKKIVRRLSSNNDVAKLCYQSLIYATTGTTIFNASDDSKGYVYWDGTLYDKSKGKYVLAKDGQYYIQLEAQIDDNYKSQNTLIPIKIDTQAPKISKFEVSKEGNNTIVTFKPIDNYNLASYFTVNVEQLDNQNKNEDCNYNHLYIETNKNKNGEYVYNLGDISDSKINFTFKDAAGNTVTSNDIIGSRYSEIVKNEGSEETDEDDESENSSEELDDEIPPVLSITKNNNIDSLFNVESGNEIYMLLNKGIKSFEFEVKVEDANFDINGFNIGESATYTYIGNQTYRITINKPSSYNYISIDLTDKAGNENSYYIYIYPSSRTEDYESIIKEIQMMVEFTNIDIYENIILNTADLNSDGTFTIEGIANYIPDKLIINNKVVSINNKTHEFIHKIKINKGYTKLAYTIIKNGEERTYSQNIYYDKVTITPKKLPKADKKGRIIVKKNSLTLYGTISAYISINYININGNNIYNSPHTRYSTNSKPLTKDYKYTVQLKKGKNIITITAKNMVGQTATKKLIIYR